MATPDVGSLIPLSVFRIFPGGCIKPGHGPAEYVFVWMLKGCVPFQHQPVFVYRQPLS